MDQSLSGATRNAPLPLPSSNPDTVEQGRKPGNGRPSSLTLTKNCDLLKVTKRNFFLPQKSFKLFCEKLAHTMLVSLFVFFGCLFFDNLIPVEAVPAREKTACVQYYAPSDPAPTLRG